MSVLQHLSYPNPFNQAETEFPVRNDHSKIAILGGGSFGTAIAAAAAKSGGVIDLVCRTEKQADLIQKTRKNSTYFPDVELPRQLHATADTTVCLDADVVFIAIPARFIDQYLQQVVSKMKPGSTVVNLVKGLDTEFLTFAEHFRNKAPGIDYVALKGPTFARPLLLGELSGLTIGTERPETERKIRNLFAGSALHFDSCRSAMSVDAVSALKNVYAIILGILVSLDLSENTRFMIVTCIINEVKQVLEHLHLDALVISLYCGIGDILLTGTCETSRNRTLGVMIGKGIPVDPNRPDFLAEGVRSVRIMLQHLEPGVAPLIEILVKVLDGHCTPGFMVEEMMHRL